MCVLIGSGKVAAEGRECISCCLTNNSNLAERTAGSSSGICLTCYHQPGRAIMDTLGETGACFASTIGAGGLVGGLG
jgi:hypothetical protein